MPTTGLLINKPKIENKNVDTTKTITHLGLCAGYGGIELGLKRIIPNLRSVALCEIEAYACANLVAKMEAGLMEPAPIWTDLKTFPWESFRDRVDILTGGYPCQPFSAAGKRLGTEDPRHLWPFIASGIRILRPKLCFFENVEGHISLGLREVIGELEQMGYKVSWGIFSAREVGAPHQRKRVFIMAHLKCAGLEGLYKWHSPSEQTEFVGADSGAGCQRSAWEGCELANSTSDRLARGLLNGETLNQTQGNTIKRGSSWPSRPGEAQHGWEPPRVVVNSKHDGLASREIGGSTCETISEQQSWEDNSLNIERTGSIAATESDGMGNAVIPRQQTQRNESNVQRREELAFESSELGNHTKQGCEGSGRTNDPRGTIDRPTESNGGCAYGAMEQSQRQTQPALGRDADGLADRMDYAELCVTCDNRTDELRLLGNGVCPPTATKAFITLYNELLKNE